MRTHIHMRGHMDWVPSSSNPERDGGSRLISSLIPAQGSPGREPSASGRVTMVPNRSLGTLGASAASHSLLVPERQGGEESGGRVWWHTQGWPEGLNSPGALGRSSRTLLLISLRTPVLRQCITTAALPSCVSGKRETNPQRSACLIHT